MEADPISEVALRSLQADMADTFAYERSPACRARHRLRTGRDRSFGVDVESTASAARFRCPVRILTDDQ